MLKKNTKGSIRSATDFWLVIGFLFFAGIGIYFTYSHVQKKEAEKIVAKDNKEVKVEKK